MLFDRIILILDSRGLESPSYTNIVKQDSNVHVICAVKWQDAPEMIEKYEPDLILAYNNFDRDITHICQEIRNINTMHRPILMVLSDEISLDKKLEVIKAGADDFHDTNTSPEEISLRIFAHIRRQEEEFANSVTRLPTAKTTYKIIKRNLELNSKEYMAVMYIGVDNYNPYNEIYGYIAAEKLIQTFVAIVKTSINENDFLGQITENGFVILTKPEKAEKVATFLNYSFDIVAPKFYSEEDVEKGYIVSSGDDKIGRRIPFVSVSIGIVSNQHRKLGSYQEVLSSSINIQKLAKSRRGSSWLSDRPKISSAEVINEKQHKVLIMEKDAALAYLLATTLEMKDYIVETANNTDEVFYSLEKEMPDLILLDIEEKNSVKELETCRAIKERYPHMSIIISSAVRNKEIILDSGADLYIPKPYELITLYNWIDRFLNGEI